MENAFSIYDIIFKSQNKWHGHAMGTIWQTTTKEHQEELKAHSGFHYVPKETFEDKWYIDVQGNAFSNFKGSDVVRTYQNYGEDWDIFGQKLFKARWWVYSLLQFDLGYEYAGFDNKKEAFAYYKKKCEDPDLFDVLIFQMRFSDITDFEPTEFTYPVHEIMDKKYHQSLYRNEGSGFQKQSFDNFFCQYLHNLIHSNYIRAHDDDRDFWWNLGIDFNEAEHMVKDEHRNYRFHLYKLLDKAFDYIYDGGCTDITFFK